MSISRYTNYQWKTGSTVNAYQVQQTGSSGLVWAGKSLLWTLPSKSLPLCPQMFKDHSDRHYSMYSIATKDCFLFVSEPVETIFVALCLNPFWTLDWHLCPSALLAAMQKKKEKNTRTVNTPSQISECMEIHCLFYSLVALCCGDVSGRQWR